MENEISSSPQNLISLANSKDANTNESQETNTVSKDQEESKACKTIDQSVSMIQSSIKINSNNHFSLLLNKFFLHTTTILLFRLFNTLTKPFLNRQLYFQTPCMVLLFS